MSEVGWKAQVHFLITLVHDLLVSHTHTHTCHHYILSRAKNILFRYHENMSQESAQVQDRVKLKISINENQIYLFLYHHSLAPFFIVVLFFSSISAFHFHINTAILFFFVLFFSHFKLKCVCVSWEEFRKSQGLSAPSLCVFLVIRWSYYQWLTLQLLFCFCTCSLNELSFHFLFQRCVRGMTLQKYRCKFRVCNYHLSQCLCEFSENETGPLIITFLWDTGVFASNPSSQYLHLVDETEDLFSLRPL